jgi:hypothetical protein
VDRKGWCSAIEVLEHRAVHHQAEDRLLRATMHIGSSLIVSTNAVAGHRDRLHALTRPEHVPAFYDEQRISSSAVALRVALAESRTALQAISHLLVAKDSVPTTDQAPAPRLTEAAVARSAPTPRPPAPSPDRRVPSAADRPRRADSGRRR